VRFLRHITFEDARFATHFFFSFFFQFSLIFTDKKLKTDFTHINPHLCLINLFHSHFYLIIVHFYRIRAFRFEWLRAKRLIE
jgi:hypothetical protein